MNAIVKIAVAVGKFIEVGAEDVLRFEAAKGPQIISATPKALASLATLASAADKVGTDVAMDATNPLALLLGGVQQAQDLIACIADGKALLETLGVKFG